MIAHVLHVIEVLNTLNFMEVTDKNVFPLVKSHCLIDATT